jgi:hypothetical protein
VIEAAVNCGSVVTPSNIRMQVINNIDTSPVPQARYWVLLIDIILLISGQNLAKNLCRSGHF